MSEALKAQFLFGFFTFTKKEKMPKQPVRVAHLYFVLSLNQVIVLTSEFEEIEG